MKRIYFAFLFLTLLGLVSCKEKEEQVEAEVSVSTITLKDTTCIMEYKVPASLRGIQDVAIYPQITGRITKINVIEGQKVSKGTVLFTIDDIPYRAAYDAAAAEVEVAKSRVASAELTLESKKRLFEQDVISEYQYKLAANDLLSAKAGQMQAEARLKDAANNLSFTRITTAVSGYVGSLPYKIGSLVSQQISTPLTIVSDKSSVYADFSLPENTYLEIASRINSTEGPNVPEGFLPLQFILNNGKRYDQTGKIKSFNGLISKETGALPVCAVFPNPDGILISGGSGQVLFSYEESGTILIPRASIKDIQDKMFVFKVEGDHLVQTEIMAERYDNKLWVVRPLENGEMPLKVGDVITSTTNKLKNGDKIAL